MPPQETGKQRAARIPLDYYTHSDFLERWKLGLGLIALLVTVAWAGAEAAMNRQQLDFKASRGPVASVHQMFGSQCSACHVDFTPISSHSWSPPFLGDPHESSHRCQTCHAGPEHHATQTPELTCASCHRDHRGPDASLVNLPDSDCTQCHKDLSKHRDWSDTWQFQFERPEFKTDVTRFAEKTHPPFRSIAKDPGKLKFNHQRHLAPGMALQKDGKTGGATQTLGSIPEAFRKRYRDQQDKKTDADPMQLQCASCHQLDAGDFGFSAQQAKEFPNSLLGQRNAGAYMLPITYENQCQACHPLTVDRKVLDDPKRGYLSVPHLWQPKEIHDFLESSFTAQIVRGQAGFLERKITRPLPGKVAELLEPKVVDAINNKVERVEIDLYTSAKLCAECHYFEGKTIPVAIKAGQTPDLNVVPTSVPRVWFQHAKFNHTAHRAVNCIDCHDKANGSITHSDVLIPDQKNCVQCHAPTTQAGSPGARFNCTECHLYHNGDHANQGIGAARRNPAKTRSIGEFLGVK